jgi:hypothetical protein
MCPERLASNLWRIEEGEFITGIDSQGSVCLRGPVVVSVHEFEGYDGLLVQGPNDEKIEISGTDFAAAVQKYPVNPVGWRSV